MRLREALTKAAAAPVLARPDWPAISRAAALDPACAGHPTLEISDLSADEDRKVEAIMNMVRLMRDKDGRLMGQQISPYQALHMLRNWPA